MLTSMLEHFQYQNEFSVRRICLQYRNKICRCWMSHVADIKIDVDAHLCLFHKGGGGEGAYYSSTLNQKKFFVQKVRPFPGSQYSFPACPILFLLLTVYRPTPRNHVCHNFFHFVFFLSPYP
jgi:hypothetical protein